MKQDLFDWLNSTHTDNTQNFSGTRGLLLAPVHDALPENPDHEDNSPAQDSSSESETSQQEELQPDTSSEEYVLSDDEDTPHDYTETIRTYSSNFGQDSITAFTDAWQGAEYIYAEPEPQLESEYVDETEKIAQEDNSQQDSSQPEEVLEDVQNSPEAADSEDTSQLDENHASILNQAWHEATGFHINFDEPPPQMWTDIDNDSEDDDSRDYEENPSLQGDAYIPVVKHGANFTQRLQAPLRGRKDKAAKQHEHDAENAHTHPYVQKAVIFCGVLLMTLAFAYLGLWFINRETPERLNERAQALYTQGKYDEAATLYQRGYKRNPEILTFLTGLARSAEKAGHTQTAIAAWNEYMSSLPKDDTEHRRAAQKELARLIPGGNTQPKAQTITLPQKVITPTKNDTPSRTTGRPALPNSRTITFDEALSEGNNAFNIGRFSLAITNFHKAHTIRPDDIRPYVGLAASYRAKGMYFDAKRMLDEAGRKFGNDPALEIERYYLRRE